MNEITFPLKLRMKGTKVGDLQTALQLLLKRGVILGDDEDARRKLVEALAEELARQYYGNATRKVVGVFQEAHQLQATGAVDEATANALNAMLRKLGLLDSEATPRYHIVSGEVRREDELPLHGVRVRAIHEIKRRSIRLGEDTTDAEGHYTIRYELLPGGDSINLRVSAIGEDGKPLKTSELVRNAKAIESIDLITPVAGKPVAEWQLTGNILLEHGLPANKIKLRLYRRDFGGKATKLDETITLEGGEYAFSFDPGGKAASLEVRAVKGNKEIVLSKPLDDLSAETPKVLNLLASSDLQPLEAEYRRLVADLTPHVGQIRKLAEAKEDSERQDLTVLNRATGWDARLIALSAMTERLSVDADVQLSSESLYGLLRAGLPSDKLLLARVDPDVAKKALEKMRDAGIVELTNQQIVQFMKEFSHFADKVRLAVPAPGSQSTYGDLLKASGLDANAQANFAKVYLSHSGDATELWKRASEAGLDGGQLGKLRRQGKFAFLAGNSEIMTTRLMNKPIKDPVELVDQDFHRAESWVKEVFDQAGIPQNRRDNLTDNDKKELDKLIPAGYMGTETKDRLDAYAEDMARKIRLSYPTQVIGRLIETNKINLPDAQNATATLLRNAAKQGFRLGETPVANFLQTNDAVRAGVADAEFEAAQQQMKMLQRVYQVTPDNKAMPVLMAMNMTSAYDVMAYSETEFTVLFDAKYLEIYQVAAISTLAGLIYRKANQVSSVTYNLFTIAKKLDSEPPVAGLSAPVEVRDSVRNELIKRFPTMESLFGSMDFCECEHCRSVLSPAAYLVDLLQFIDPEDGVWGNFLAHWKMAHNNQDYPHKDKNGTAMKPYDVLIERRSDLPHIPLTCENTHTALPYIDVVNEILEYYVAHGKLEEEAANDTGETTTAELLAEPQNVIREAYDKLRAARYPFNLPFDLWLETVRQFCNYFETPLYEVLESLRKSDSLFAPAQPFDRASIFIESLGLSSVEAAVFTDSDPLGNDNWFELYGLPTDRPAIQNPTNAGDATLTIANADAAKFREGLACTYFDVSAATLNAESKTITTIGSADSGGVGRSVITFSGVWAAPPDAGDFLVCSAEATLKSAKALSRRLGVTYKEITEIVKTGFVNPKLAELSILYKLGVSIHDAGFYRDHKGLVGRDPATLSSEEQKRQLEVEAFAKALQQFADMYQVPPAQLDAEVLAIPFDRVLLLVDPDAGCNFDLTTLCYADGSQADAITFLRINLFVRLWRKLGWTIEETDRALHAFVPKTAPFESGHLNKRPLQTALIYLAHLKTLDNKLRVGRQSRIKLTTLWSDIATSGKDPLYVQCLLTRSVLKSDPVFDHPLGQYLSAGWISTMAQSRKYRVQLENVAPADKIDPAQFAGEPKLELTYDGLRNVQYLSFEGVLSDAKKAALVALSPSPALPLLLDAAQIQAKEFALVKGHSLTLQGALGLTADEIRRILEDAGKSLDTADLSIANVSLLYRYNLLAKTLKLSVRELIALKQLSGLEPFKPLHPDPLTAIEEDHPFYHTLRFIEIADDVKESGLKIEDLEYLARHRFDETGKYRPNPEGMLVQLKTLAEGVRAIRIEHAVPDDPGSLGEEIQRQKLGLVLPPDVAETFLAMMNGTMEYTATKTGVGAAQELAPEAFADEPAIVEVSYNAIRQEQKLTLKGVLFDAAKADLKARLPKPIPPNPHVPSPVFDELLEKVEQQARSFFEKHLQKQPPGAQPAGGFLEAADFDLLFDPDLALAPGETEQDRIRKRRTKVVEAFLPFLQQRLISQFIVQTMTAQTGADPVLVESLLTDARLLAAPKPLLDALSESAERGLTATFFSSVDGTGAALATVTFADANTGLKDKDGNNLKPAGARSARIVGYLEVPLPETYRFFIALEKQNTEAELRFDHLSDPVFISGVAAADNAVLGEQPNEFLELKPGIPYRFTLELKNLTGGNAQLLVQGETLPKDGLSQLKLYASSAIAGAERATVLLAKVLQLVQGLGLSEREIRYLLTHAAAFAGLNLSNLPTAKSDDTPAGAKALFKQFLRLAGYARLKRDLADGTDDLIAIFEANELAAPDKLEKEVYPRIARLTRRDEATVKSSAETLFVLPAFDSDKPLQRLWKVLQIVERFGAPVASLLNWMHIVSDAATPEQRFEIARDLKESIKARFESENWHRVAQPIFDKLRQRQRDALVSYVMYQNGFDRMEQLYEYFLIDPGMEPVVQTSRIRLAIASLQLFIQRSLLNLELKVHPSTINSKQWEWMKRYRVWEANRKIFLFPENWLEPEFRDDKTHLFAALEGALLQGDVSRDLVEDAFLSYLKKLDELARLDIVAMHIEDNPDPARRTLHVFGRTYSQPHKHFYRRYAHQMWTPWEPVSAEIEGDHLAPVIWRDRLYLFWVTFMDKPKEDPKPTGTNANKKLTELKLGETVGAIQSMVKKKKVEIQLHWSEYLQGEWSTRESGGFSAVISKTVPIGFDPGSVLIHVSKEFDKGEERGVYITLGGAIKSLRIGSFYLAGRNSMPDQSAYRAKPTNLFNADEVKATRYSGHDTLKVTFKQRITTEGYKIKVVNNPLTILEQTIEYSILPCNNTITLGGPDSGSLDADNPEVVADAIEAGLPEIASLIKPVFYQNNTDTLFVEPNVTEKTIEEWEDWITIAPQPEPGWTIPGKLPDIVVIPEIPWKPPFPDPVDPWRVPIDHGSLINPGPIFDWLANPLTGFRFDDTVIGPSGSMGATVLPLHEVEAAMTEGAISKDDMLVNIHGSSDLDRGTIAVIPHSVLEQTGLSQVAGGISVVGAAGFNSELGQNFNELNRSRISVVR